MHRDAILIHEFADSQFLVGLGPNGWHRVINETKCGPKLFGTGLDHIE